MSAPWSAEEDDALRKAAGARMSVTRMSARLGRPLKGIRHRLVRLGLQVPA